MSVSDWASYVLENSAPSIASPLPTTRLSQFRGISWKCRFQDARELRSREGLCWATTKSVPEICAVAPANPPADGERALIRPGRKTPDPFLSTPTSFLLDALSLLPACKPDRGISDEETAHQVVERRCGKPFSKAYERYSPHALSRASVSDPFERLFMQFDVGLDLEEEGLPGFLASKSSSKKWRATGTDRARRVQQ